MRQSSRPNRPAALILLLLLAISSISVDPLQAQVPLTGGAFIPFSGRWGESGRECAKGLLDSGKWINGLAPRYGSVIQLSDMDRGSSLPI